jgi:hypothetical protein
MADRISIKLPESLADDLAEHKREDQTWPAFVREDVLPALEDEDELNPIDYAHLADRVSERVVREMGGR